MHSTGMVLPAPVGPRTVRQSPRPTIGERPRNVSADHFSPPDRVRLLVSGELARLTEAFRAGRDGAVKADSRRARNVFSGFVRDDRRFP